jgi:teichuronic acid biosynthesis glycosyltransferase TuaG
LNKTPFITVIVPIYNGEKYLSETVQSVIDQTYDNWELILINDGSTDKTASIINDFVGLDRRIKKITIPESSGGPAYPRNLGLDLAKGEYVAFLDADDLWATQKLALQIDFLTYAKADMVHCGGITINALGEKIGNVESFKKHRFFKFFLGNSVALMMNNPIILSSSLISKSEIFKFREDKDLEAVEDWFLWIESYLSGKKIRMLNKNLMSYRSHDESISKMLDEVQFLRSFKIYTVLLLEKKIGLWRFWIICSLQLLNLCRLRVQGKFQGN